MNKKAFVLIALYFLYGISVSLIHPVTPSFVGYLGINDFYYGLFYSAMSLGMFSGSLFFGFMSKRIKRSILLPIGIVGYASAQLLFGFANSIDWLILLWRFMGGFSVAAPLSFYTSFSNDISPSKASRDKLLLVLAPIEIVGEAFGYKVGGYLYTYASFSFDNLFVLQIIVLLITSLLSFLFLYRNEKNAEFAIAEDNGKEKKSISPFMVFFLSMILLATFAQIMTTKYSEKYVIEIGYTSDDLGTIMMVCALAGAIACFALSLLSKKISINYPLLYTILLIIAGSGVLITYLIPVSGYMVAVYSTYLLFYVAKCMIASTDTRIILENSSEKTKGFNMGLRQAFLAIGNFLGPLVAGLIYGANHLANFYVASAIYMTLFVVMICYLLLSKRRLNRA